MRSAPYVAWLAVVGLGCAQVTGLDELSSGEGTPNGAGAAPGAGTPNGGANGTPDAGPGVVIGREGGERLGQGGEGSIARVGAGSNAGSAGGTSSNGGSAGSAGGGAVGMSSNAGAGGGPAAGAGGDASEVETLPVECMGDADCEGSGACTPVSCQEGACVASVAAPGTPCGSASDDACANPDSCDAQGVCQANDEPLGTGCPGGTCIGAECVAAPASGCAVDVATSVPVMTAWSSVGRPDLYDGGCDSEGTPDYALVFIAPEAGTYRISATALVDGVPYTGADVSSGVPTEPPDGDCVMTIAEGNCAGESRQIGCNDDVAMGNIGSQLDVELDAQQVITVYLNELTQTGGGTGALAITRLP